jgi:hypothetical protein
VINSFKEIISKTNSLLEPNFYEWSYSDSCPSIPNICCGMHKVTLLRFTCQFFYFQINLEELLSFVLFMAMVVKVKLLLIGVKIVHLLFYRYF